MFLDGKSVLITGGTGSLGHALVKRLVDTDVELRVFSRDEAKQDAMRQLYPKVDYITGDIRDPVALTDAMEGADYVFHAAALKQVPNCERFPVEAIRTNTLGALNLAEAAKKCRPRAVIAISTDKAVEPLNTMGLTKALMERIVLSRDTPEMMVVRYGNVIGSRGSVVPLFLDCIANGRSLPITNRHMTRFLFCLSDAVDLLLRVAEDGVGGQLWVKKMPAATVDTIAQACLKFRGQERRSTEQFGIRPGEKMHEVLVTSDERRRAKETGEHFIIYQGFEVFGTMDEYTSENTERLDVDGVVKLLEKAGL